MIASVGSRAHLLSQNVTWMNASPGIVPFRGDRAGLAEFPTYHDCLSRVTCAPPSPECYLDECESCPGIVPLRDELLSVLDESDIDQVIYKQWVSTDRSTLETHCTSADECGFILRKAGAPASTLIHSQATSFLLLAAQV